MDSARWERVKAVFQDTFEKEPAERAALLAAACGDDAEVRMLADRLLAAHGSVGTFLDTPLQPETRSASLLGERERSAESLALQGPKPERIGAYRIVRELGRGGMGTVYLAERDDAGFKKTVAIKVVSRDSHVMMRRFRTETQILATLEHPGIARLYDGGTTEEGLPYFVMEYVAGENIVAYCEGHHLSIADRLRLFRRVCEAVQFAHQSFIVHRDLKPSNILVTAEGEPKLLDFGIAKLLNPELAGGPVEETMEMTRLLTPQYASPEHVRGQAVTTASDVYSLGIILYELVSGSRPYRITSDRPTDIERAVCETEPPPPSAAAPARARRLLRGDVDNIVLKTLRKEPAQRYGTAADLAEDVRRYLDGFPVHARPDAFLYRTRKFLVRRAVPLAAVGAILVAIAAGTLSTLAQSRRATRRFNEVRGLAHAFLFDVYDAISALPGSVSARRLVVGRAQQYLDSLAREVEDDPSLTRELAGSYLRLGDVRGKPYTPNLGDTAGALESYQKGLALLERESARHPGDLAIQEELVQANMDVGVIFMRQKRADASIAAANRAIALAQALTERDPRNPVFTEKLSNAYLRLGQAQDVAAEQRGSIAEKWQVLATYKKAVGILEAAGPHAEPFWQARLATLYFYIGYPLRVLGDRTGDVRYYKESLDSSLKGDAINRQLLAADPNRIDYIRRLADGLTSIGEYRWKCCGDLAGALRDEREASAAFQQILERDPQNVEARRDVANAYNNLGRILGEAHRPSEGLEALRKALALYEQVSRADPTSAEDASYVAEMRARIAAIERAR